MAERRRGPIYEVPALCLRCRAGVGRIFGDAEGCIHMFFFLRRAAMKQVRI